MKLDINCVRDILLTIESINYPVCIPRKEFCSRINNYSENEIEYCCLKLYEGNYIMLYIPKEYPTYEARIKIDYIGDFSLTAAKEIGMTLLQSALSSILPLS